MFALKIVCPTIPGVMQHIFHIMFMFFARKYHVSLIASYTKRQHCVLKDGCMYCVFHYWYLVLG